MAIVLDPSLPEVRAAAERSREIFQQLGARPFLERLEAALARGHDSVAALPTTHPSSGLEPAGEPVG